MLYFDFLPLVQRTGCCAEHVGHHHGRCSACSSGRHDGRNDLCSTEAQAGRRLLYQSAEDQSSRKSSVLLLRQGEWDVLVHKSIKSNRLLLPTRKEYKKQE